MINAGNYEGQAIKGKFQLSESSVGTLQIAIDMELFSGKESVGMMTTLLYFSEGAAVYSYERLRMLGWKGTGPDDLALSRIGDIYSTRVPVRVTTPEPFKDPKDGITKMGVSKLEIVTGGGTLVMNRPVDEATWISRLKAMGGSSGGGSGSSSSGEVKPPF